MWKTGVMILDMMAIEIFMSATRAIGDSASSGVAVVLMPVETAAAIQVELNAPAETGSYSYWPFAMGGGGGAGDVYPI